MANKGYVLSATIPSLIQAARPSAVARFVVSIYINTINRCSDKWARSNVSDECFKRRLPFFADADTATAVILVIWAMLGTTAHSHVHPTMIFGAKASAAGIAMLQAPLRCDFGEIAATAARAPRFKLVAIDGWTNCAAIAPAIPVWLHECADSTTKNGETIKFVAGQVNQGGHVVSLSRHG